MSQAIALFLRLVSAALAAVFLCLPAMAASTPYHLTSLPLGEHWFAILVDNDQVGFYCEKVRVLPNGDYQVEGDGSVRMKIMGFTKQSSSREIYQVGPDLTLKTVTVEQTINGKKSRLSGSMAAGGLKLRREAGGKATVRLLKTKSSVIPGPLLNLVPLFRGAATGKQHTVLSFDPEESALKEVEITVLGEDKTPDGQPALKLRNNLYPFVDNDIWVDARGNTLLESVRDGLVVTRAEAPEKLAAFISGMALAKKDLIYDFSLVRSTPPLRHNPAGLSGLTVAINGYAAQIPLLADGWQQVERQGDRVLIRTGSLRQPGPGATEGQAVVERYLQPAEGIESTAAEISFKSRELTAGLPNNRAKAQALVNWVATWLSDSIDDGGSALESLSSKHGNCQTHARLYTALARAAGIPTRFVSGLVSQDGSGFLYHSWAESYLDGAWVAVDPTFNQLPADPTHLAFFEGNRLVDLTPLVGVIGKISLSVVEEK